MLGRGRAIRDGLVIAGLLLAFSQTVIQGDHPWENAFADLLAYRGIDFAAPYADSFVGGPSAYLYSPAFAQAFWLFGWIPAPLFVALWTALLIGTVAWLARPLPAAVLMLALPIGQEIVTSNIHLLLAAAIVLGFRYPATWAFVLLTKVTPGIGLIWFPVRRQWRNLAIALGATAAIAAISFVVSPGWWRSWIELLTRSGSGEGIRLLARLPIAAALVAWGAHTNHRWTVPVGAMLALPVIWTDSFSMLLGVVPLLSRNTIDFLNGRAPEMPPARAGTPAGGR